jgi:hypothetical protein
VSRREFLKTVGSLVVGFSLMPFLPASAAAAGAAATKAVSPDGDGFFSVHRVRRRFMKASPALCKTDTRHGF